MYHTLDKPIISDSDYDKLFRLLQDLVNDNPQFKPINSVLDRVGGEVLAGFETIKHKKKMTSLANVFSLEELRDFYDKIEYDIELECEPKMDGLAISIFYKMVSLIMLLHVVMVFRVKKFQKMLKLSAMSHLN